MEIGGDLLRGRRVQNLVRIKIEVTKCHYL